MVVRTLVGYDCCGSNVGAFACPFLFAFGRHKNERLTKSRFHTPEDKYLDPDAISNAAREHLAMSGSQQYEGWQYDDQPLEVWVRKHVREANEDTPADDLFHHVPEQIRRMLNDGASVADIVAQMESLRRKLDDLLTEMRPMVAEKPEAEVPCPRI